MCSGTKQAAHRLKIIFGLAGLKAQRLEVCCLFWSVYLCILALFVHFVVNAIILGSVGHLDLLSSAERLMVVVFHFSLGQIIYTKIQMISGNGFCLNWNLSNALLILPTFSKHRLLFLTHFMGDIHQVYQKLFKTQIMLCSFSFDWKYIFSRLLN